MDLFLSALLSISSFVMDVAPLADGILVLGRESVAWAGTPGIFAAAEVGCDRLYHPSTSPDGSTVAVWAGSDDDDCILLVRTRGVEVLGPYGEAGLPAWDASGGLWFTAEGALLRNGEPSGILLDAHHISLSPEGDRVVHTDREDRILVTSTLTGRSEIVSDAFRFYGAFFTPQGAIVSASLDGGIWIFSDEEAVSVGTGEQPAWWPEHQCLVFVRTTDDGEQLLTSDLWTWTPEEGARVYSQTADVLELSPLPLRDGICYVDAAGTVGFAEAATP